MVGPSKSRPPMSHRKTDLGIPRPRRTAKVVLVIWNASSPHYKKSARSFERRALMAIDAEDKGSVGRGKVKADETNPEATSSAANSEVVPCRT